MARARAVAMSGLWPGLWRGWGQDQDWGQVCGGAGARAGARTVARARAGTRVSLRASTGTRAMAGLRPGLGSTGQAWLGHQKNNLPTSGGGTLLKTWLV